MQQHTLVHSSCKALSVIKIIYLREALSLMQTNAWQFKILKKVQPLFDCVHSPESDSTSSCEWLHWRPFYSVLCLSVEQNEE